MKLTLGETTVDIIATPGHTPGTLSYVFPVQDQGKTVMVRVFRRHAHGRFWYERRQMGRIHRVSKKDRESGR